MKVICECGLIIDQKLDNTCTLIKNNNVTTQQHLTNGNQTNNVSHTKENINQQLLNRRRLHYQILRSQDLQECYNNLISQESPHVPAKFIFKINSNTPAYEIPLHRNAAIDNLKREIRLLEEKQKQWKIFDFFFYQGFLLRTLTTHRTVGEGRGPSYSTLQLPPAQEHSDIYLQLCM